MTRHNAFCLAAGASCLLEETSRIKRRKAELFIQCAWMPVLEPSPLYMSCFWEIAAAMSSPVWCSLFLFRNWESFLVFIPIAATALPHSHSTTSSLTCAARTWSSCSFIAATLTVNSASFVGLMTVLKTSFAAWVGTDWASLVMATWPSVCGCAGAWVGTVWAPPVMATWPSVCGCAGVGCTHMSWVSSKYLCTWNCGSGLWAGIGCGWTSGLHGALWNGIPLIETQGAGQQAPGRGPVMSQAFGTDLTVG